MICPQSNSPICRRHWPPPPPPALSSNACNCYGCCREARDTQQSLDVKNINTIFIKSNCTHLTKRQTCHGWRNHKIQSEILEWSKLPGQIEASPPANLSVSHPRSENGKVDGYFILFHCFYSAQGWIWSLPGQSTPPQSSPPTRGREPGVGRDYSHQHTWSASFWSPPGPSQSHRPAR